MKYLLLFFVILACSRHELTTTPKSLPLGNGANVVPSIADSDLVELIRDWKAQTIRILDNDVINHKAPHEIYQDKLENMFHVADLALKEGAAVVIAPGANFDNHQEFFLSGEQRKAFKNYWVKVVEHFKNHEGRVIYDLFNEPHDAAAATMWSPYAQELIDLIRLSDTRHEIMIEPPEWGWPKGFTFMKPLNGNRLIYSFHFYGPMDFTHVRGYDKNGRLLGHLKATDKERIARAYPGFIQGESWNKEKLRRELAPAADFRNRFQVMVWCGEFGTVRFANGAFDWMNDMIAVLRQFGFNWAYYSFREWQPMDIEMDPQVINKKTVRQETSLSQLLKRAMRGE